MRRNRERLPHNLKMSWANKSCLERDVSQMNVCTQATSTE
jgi:hypothetical protein